MKLLICTDGSPSSLQISEFILQMRIKEDTRITIFGVIETEAASEEIFSSMEQIEKKLHLNYTVDKKIRSGNSIEEVMSETIAEKYDLVAIGGGRKQLDYFHPQLGSTAAKLARKLHSPFLVVRNVPQKLSKVLFCTGAEAPASRTMTVGGKWISNTEAHIGLLHVLPKKASLGKYADEMLLRDVHDNNNMKDLVLDKASQQLRAVGIKKITPRIRQGLVVEEILNELSEGLYELLIIGAHYQPGQDRWQGTLLDDVTDQLLRKCACSVLIV